MSLVPRIPRLRMHPMMPDPRTGFRRPYGRSDRQRLAALAAGVALLALLGWLAAGCASAPITVTYSPGQPGPLGGANPQLASVTVVPTAYGRQCFSLDVSRDGTVAVVFGVDGTSDWAGIRAIPLILPEIVSAVMAVVGAPVEMIGELLGVPREAAPPPSALSACSAIFE